MIELFKIMRIHINSGYGNHYCIKVTDFKKWGNHSLDKWKVFNYQSKDLSSNNKSAFIASFEDFKTILIKQDILLNETESRLLWQSTGIWYEYETISVLSSLAPIFNLRI